MKKYFFIFFSIIFITAGQNIYSEKVLEIVTHENVPPHIIQKNGTSEGIDVDIVKELFNRLNIKYVIKHYPWRRAINRVETGLSDIIFPAFKTTEREKFAVYPEHPLEIMRFSIFVRKDEIFIYNSPNDLQRKTIGLTRGFSAGPVFDEARKKGNFKVEETNNTESDIKKLIEGRIDCFIQQHTVAKHFIKIANLSDKITEVANPVGNEIPTYLILSKHSGIDNIDELSQKIGETLNEMWDDGTIDKIISRYLE